jgi:hypothetical protein
MKCFKIQFIFSKFPIQLQSGSYLGPGKQSPSPPPPPGDDVKNLFYSSFTIGHREVLHSSRLRPYNKILNYAENFFSKGKHSSLFIPIVNYKDKSFYSIDSREML